MSKVVVVKRWVHISLHRTEVERQIDLRVATIEKGGFPLSETLKIAENDIFDLTSEKLP